MLTTYSHIVAYCGKRDNITKDFLKSIEIPENKIEIITGVSNRSRGGKITRTKFTNCSRYSPASHSIK